MRIYRRRPERGELTYPILHAGNFRLPALRGDFGSGAVELMRGAHVLVTLVEYEPAATRTALFATTGPRPFHHSDFSPRQLQRTLAGQSGAQSFFHTHGRAFCLYVVLGSHARRRSLTSLANALISSLGVA